MSRDDAGLGALKSGLAVFSRLFDHRAILQGNLYFIFTYLRIKCVLKHNIIIDRLLHDSGNI